MRYFDIEVIPFVNVFGEVKNLHQMYKGEPAPNSDSRMKPAEMDLDLMYSTLYGENLEGNTYQLRDANIAALLDYNFDEAKLRRVRLV
jgi:hypothetical protein